MGARLGRGLVEALAGDLAEAYGISEADAYEHAGISTMNGHTDERAETVELSKTWQTMLFLRTCVVTSRA